MDTVAAVLQGTDPVAPGAPAQLAALVAALGGALAAALLAAIWVRWRRAAGPAGDPLDASREAAADPAGILRLFAAAALALLALPAAAAIRQLWPHPELGWRLVAGWTAFVVPVVIACLVLGRAARSPGARS